MMPGENGFDFARDLRKTSAVPILMLTARDAAESRIPGLEIGADDYVVQAVRAARTVAAHRLHPASAPSRPPRRRPRSLRFGAVRLSHRRAANCAAATRSIRLTDREREMLRVLAAAPGETVPRLALAGNGGAVNERAVDVQINRLRRKIETRSGQSADRADRARRRLPAGGVAMTQRSTSASRACARRAVARHVRTALGPLRRLVQALHAEGALCPLAAHHHRADGDPAVGGRLRVHGAALEPGDAAAVGRGGAGHRRADRHLQGLSAGRRSRAAAKHRAGPAGPRRSISCRSPTCRRRGRSRSSRCSTRRCRTSCASRSAGRSGSTRSAAPTWSRSASSSTTP